MTEPTDTPQQPAPPPYSYPYPYPYPTGPYPGGGYPPPPPVPYAGYPPPPVGPRNGLGVAALIIAIVGLVSSFTVVGGVVLGIVAMIIGLAARGRVKRGEADNGGIALAGMVLGAIAIVAGLVFIVVYVNAFKDTGIGEYVDCMSKAGSDQTAQRLCENEFRRSVQTQFSLTATPRP